MTRLLQDVRYACRMLRKTPGATTIAVASLALGIAINTTIFGWIRGVLLNPLPGVADPGGLVTIETVAPSGTMIDNSFPDYRTFRDSSTLFSGVIAFKERGVGLGVDRAAERAWALLVTGNYFDVLGIKPALGRFFEGDERSDAIDAHPVAVLGYSMWQARFRGDPTIVGHTLVVNRRPYTVIGVAPEAFPGTITGLRFDLYLPLTTHPSLTGAQQSWMSNRRNRPLYLFARLANGVTIDQARSEIVRIAATSASEFPQSNAGISATLLPAAHARRGMQNDLGPLLRILFAVGGIVLLIVCANVANLQLARGTARRREMAIRLGLGASPSTLIRQLLTEGLVLGVVSGGLGVLASAWLMDSLRLLLPVTEYPTVLPASIRGEELLFALAASIAASLLFALAPALRASASGIVDALNAGRQGDDVRTSRIGAGLVAGQVALALAALVGAGLLVRSFENARRMHPGFDVDNVLLAGVNLSVAGYSRAESLTFLQRAVDGLKTLPGVRAVAVSEDVPLGFNGGSWEDVTITGYTPRAGENMKIYRNLVSPGYFDLMGMRLVEGRDFTALDVRETPSVAVVNRTFVQRYAVGGQAVGRTFTGWGRTLTVVGVVADSKYHALSEESQPYLYVPLAQFFSASTGAALHVRTAGDPLAVAPAVRDAIRALDPAVPPDLMTTLAAYTSASYFPQRIAASLLSILGTLALVLSAIGLYGVVACGVARRQREFGVRIALGATGGDIVRMVVWRGLALAVIGLACGSVLTVLGTRTLRSLLFDVSPLDPVVLSGAAVLLVLISGAASLVPAWVASRVEPHTALRAD